MKLKREELKSFSSSNADYELLPSVLIYFLHGNLLSEFSKGLENVRSLFLAPRGPEGFKRRGNGEIWWGGTSKRGEAREEGGNCNQKGHKATPKALSKDDVPSHPRTAPFGFVVVGWIFKRPLVPADKKSQSSGVYKPLSIYFQAQSLHKQVYGVGLWSCPGWPSVSSSEARKTFALRFGMGGKVRYKLIVSSTRARVRDWGYLLKGSGALWELLSNDGH